METIIMTPRISKERLIAMYTDLSMAQYEDLEGAAAGTLQKMNGARRESMKDLVNPDLSLTPAGLDVLKLAAQIWNGIVPEQHPIETIYPSSAAIKLRKKVWWKWIKADHIKIIMQLTQYPGMAHGHLAGNFGYSILADLERRSIISSQRNKSSRVELLWAGQEIALAVINLKESKVEVKS